MSDVLARLMRWMETPVWVSDIDDADVVLRDAITEIAGLRARLHEHRLAIRRLAEQDATLSVCDGAVTVTMDATLTAEERDAVRFSVTASLPETEKLGGVAAELCRMHAATLRGLLERLGP